MTFRDDGFAEILTRFTSDADNHFATFLIATGGVDPWQVDTNA